MLKRIAKFLAGLSLLAILNSDTPAEEIRINVSSTSNTNVGDSYIYNYHKEGALEGLDTNDVLRTSSSSKQQWLRAYTKIGDNTNEYIREFKPAESETLFTNYVRVIDGIGTGVSCACKMKVSLSDDLESNRVYTIRVNYPYFPLEKQVVDIRKLEREDNGNFQLKEITEATNNQVHCTIEVSSRFLVAPRITQIRGEGTNINLEAIAQPATINIPLFSSNLTTLTSSNWTSISNQAVYFTPDKRNFNKTPNDKDYNERTIIQTQPKTNSSGFYRINSKLTP